MHVLFLAPRMPLPADTGGKIRTFNIIKQIVKHCKMDLVCFSFEKDDDKYRKELEHLGINVTLVPAQEPSLLKKIGLILFSSIPYSAAKYYTREMDEVIKGLIGENIYDLVHGDHIHMAHYIRLLGNIPCVIDEHNVEYRILERCARVESSFIKRMLFMDQARKMREFEKKMASQCSACFVVSDEDGQILKQLVGSRKTIYTLPNGVDTEYFNTRATSHEPRDTEDSVVFTGSMDWLPNDDAVIYFCEEILPRIWKAKPEVNFYIVGKAPSKKLKEFADHEKRIIITGRVDDVRTYVNRAKVFVVPLRIGGGTRLKILEAMSMEKAVVATTVGAEGIDYTEDVNIVLADDPNVFAQRIVSLIHNSAKCRLLGSAGRKLVLDKYDWDVIGSQLEKIYEKVKIK